MLIVKCSQCEKDINRKPSEIKKCKDLFCSKQCYNIYMRKGSNVICNWCGKEFYKSPSAIHPNNFCGSSCRNLWLGDRNIKVMNVVGHTKGHKAPHLTVLNRQRNPLCRFAYNKKQVDSKLYRRIMEAHLGRSLQKQEVIHHVSGVRTDNTLENLQLMSPQAHSRLHMIVAISKFKKITDRR